MLRTTKSHNMEGEMKSYQPYQADLKVIAAILVLNFFFLVPPSIFAESQLPPAEAKPASPPAGAKESETLCQIRKRAHLCLHFLENLKAQPHLSLPEEERERLIVALRFTRIVAASESDFRKQLEEAESDEIPAAAVVKDSQEGRQAYFAILVNEDASIESKDLHALDLEVLNLYRKVAGLPPSFLRQAEPLLKIMEWPNTKHLGQPEVRGSR